MIKVLSSEQHFVHYHVQCAVFGMDSVRMIARGVHKGGTLSGEVIQEEGIKRLV